VEEAFFYALELPPAVEAIVPAQVPAGLNFHAWQEAQLLLLIAMQAPRGLLSSLVTDNASNLMLGLLRSYMLTVPYASARSQQLSAASKALLPPPLPLWPSKPPNQRWTRLQPCTQAGRSSSSLTTLSLRPPTPFPPPPPLPWPSPWASRSRSPLSSSRPPPRPPLPPPLPR
jgi:hypothetical protein